MVSSSSKFSWRFLLLIPATAAAALAATLLAAELLLFAFKQLFLFCVLLFTCLSFFSLCFSATEEEDTAPAALFFGVVAIGENAVEPFEFELLEQVEDDEADFFKDFKAFLFDDDVDEDECSDEDEEELTTLLAEFLLFCCEVAFKLEQLLRSFLWLFCFFEEDVEPAPMLSLSLDLCFLSDFSVLSLS